MKEYITHGTTIENLEKILEKKYLDTDIKEKNLAILDKSYSQIFTHLMYRDIPNQEYEDTPHWFNVCLVFDKKILKDLPFYATNEGFFENFDDVFLENKNNKNILVKSRGDVKKIPNLSKLKKFIDIQMSIENANYINSHEILFGKKISLKKYCKCIIIRSLNIDDLPEKIILLASKLKIPIKSYRLRKMKPIGLNNFIDIIET